MEATFEKLRTLQDILYAKFKLEKEINEIPKALVTFRLDGHAKVEDVKITMREYGDVTAKRSADAAGATPAVVLGKDELRKFLGKYETQKPPLEASVELVGDRLKLVASGFPEVTLVPVGPTRFKAEGAPAGTFVQFEMADGKVKGVTVDIKDGPSVKLLPKK